MIIGNDVGVFISSFRQILITSAGAIVDRSTSESAARTKSGPCKSVNRTVLLRVAPELAKLTVCTVCKENIRSAELCDHICYVHESIHPVRV